MRQTEQQQTQGVAANRPTAGQEQPLGEIVIPQWADLVPREEWDAYAEVLRAVEASAAPFMVGGGFAFSTHCGRWRNTKDLDFFIREQDRETFVEVLTRLRFIDYFDEKSYDRSWIYRAVRDGVIVDVIWQFANHRAQVDDAFLAHAPWVRVRADTFRILGPEDLCFAKLYVFQRERFDWPDLLNVLDSQAGRMDWDYLVGRLGDDVRLLGGLLSTFAWMRPEQARLVPQRVWDAVEVAPPSADVRNDPDRVALLDSRDWFGPRQDP